MVELAEDIGKRIKAKRESIQLNQKKLAEKVKISPAAINKFEKGEKKPSTEVLLRISEVLHVTTDYLLTGIDEENGDIKAAFRGFKKLSAKDQDTVRGLVKLLQEKNKEDE